MKNQLANPARINTLVVGSDEFEWGDRESAQC